VFHGYSTGDVRLWTNPTGQDIVGNFTSVPLENGDAVHLIGDGLSADFQINKWNSNRWAAIISNGTGTLSVPLNFHGWARGGFTGTTSGSFTGKGVGPASK
jgi:hypothetical protein